MTIRIGLIHNFGHKTMKNVRFEKLLAIFMLAGTIVFNLWLYRLEPTAKIDPNDNTFQYALVDRTNQIWDYAQQSCANEKLKIKSEKLSLRQKVLSPFSNFALCTFNFALLFDHWVPNWAQGYNLPYYYSHLPQIVIVGSWRFFNWFLGQIGSISLFQYYHLIIYLLLSFFPLSVFWSLRIAGLSWLPAGIGSLLATQISTDGLYGLDPPSFLWRGYGLSSQLFAMIFLPLALAYSFRYFSTLRWEGWTFLEQLKIFFRKIRETVTAKNLQLVSTRTNYRNQQSPVRAGSKNAPADPSFFFPAVFFLFATTAGHLGIGIIAFLSIGILALTPTVYSILNQKSKELTIKQLRSDLTKLIILAGVAIFFLSYWIVPIFLNGNYHNISVWDPIWKFDSYGAKEIVNKLFNGDLFDFGRLPVFSLLVLIGLLASLNTQLSGFSLLLLFWVIMYFGRTTWGGLIDFIPGMREFHLSRFSVGVHLAGLFLAPIGLGWIIDSVTNAIKFFWRITHNDLRFTKSVHLLAYALIGLLVVFTLYPQTIRYNQTNEVLIRRANDNYAKVAGDFNDLLTTLRRLEAERPGRILAGRGGSWGKNFRIAETPYYMALSTEGLPVVLWLPETWSPNSDTEQFLSEGLERDYALYNIRYVVTPPSQPTQSFWKLVKASPSWKLYAVNTPGYFSLGTRPAIVAVAKENYLNLVHLWIQSDYPQKGLFPQLTFTKNYPKNTGLPNFRLLDEANYLVPDETVHNLMKDPPRYIPPNESAIDKLLILSQENASDMIFKAKVEVPKDCVECLVVLKQSYHPNWKATIDGREVKPINVFPFFLAVPLSEKGTHEVVFSYEPARIKVALLGLEVAVLMSLIILAKLRAGETEVSP